MNNKLHISLEEFHPAYQWAKKQSDSVKAIGHIGTHIDCYSSMPKESVYDVDVVIVDCREEMLSVKDVGNLDCEGKAIILYTGILNTHEYGTNEYGNSVSYLKEDTLDILLTRRPKFILIDACGIGNHGEEHIRFDKKCEAHDCFVVENVFLNDEIVSNMKKIKIIIDIDSVSTGKACKIYIQ